MADSLLTTRDCKAIELLLNRAIDNLPDNPNEAELWRCVLRRFKGDVSARPSSISGSVIALLGAARSGDLNEVDRLGKNIAEGLLRHGDMDGSAALKRVAEAMYERPEPPKGSKAASARPVGAASPPPAGSANTQPQAPPKRSVENEHVAWFDPEDLSEVMVLDDTTGPAIRRLIDELKARHALIDVDIDPPSRSVFHGPPGTGKTLGVRYVGGALDLPVVAVKIGRLLSKYLGETTKNLMMAIEYAQKEGAIIFLDEIESICGNRSDGAQGAHDEYKRLTGALLQCLDQLPRDQIVVGATNYLNKLDGALLDRMAFKVAFAFPDEVARTAQVNRLWRMVKSDAGARGYLVQATEGKSGRFIRAAAMAAARAAVMEASRNAAAGTVQVDKALITQEHVEPSIELARRSEEEADAEEEATTGVVRPKRKAPEPAKPPPKKNDIN